MNGSSPRGGTVREVLGRIGMLLLPVAVFTAFPLDLYARNLGDVEASDVTRSMVLMAAVGLVMTGVCQILFRDLLRAALMASISGMVLLSYGHVFTLVRDVQVGGIVLGRHRFLLAASGAFLLLVALVLRQKREVARSMAAGLGLTVIVMLAWALLRIIRYEATRAIRAEARPDTSSAAMASALPDIYYIIPDTHARADTLQETYAVDSSGFLSGLRERGFFIGDYSLSNYASTDLSLASSLNMLYLDSLVDALGADYGDLTPAERMIQDNAAVDLAHSLGYTVIAYESEAPFVRFDKADEVYAPDLTSGPTGWRLGQAIDVNPYENLLLDTTAARIIFDLGWVPRGELAKTSYWRHRQMLLFPLQHVWRVAAREEPTLVLMHLMAPHPPFVFGPNGEEVNDDRPFGLMDIGCCESEDYIAGYRDQVTYVDRLLLDAVDDILAASDSPTIIIIQGDTGPASQLTWTDPTPSAIQERMRILNAYLLPDECRDSLYPTITPVNTFRVVFGECLGLEVDLLPDYSYYSTYLKPFDFEPVVDAGR